MLPRKTDERDEKQEEVWLQPFLAEAALDHPVPEGLAYDTRKAVLGPGAGLLQERILSLCGSQMTILGGGTCVVTVGQEGLLPAESTSFYIKIHIASPGPKTALSA